MKKLVSKECRFATHCFPPMGERDDLHVIKEILHYDDGTYEPTVRLEYNFKRPFWVTKKGFQNHKDKKEWEKSERLDMRLCTQSELNYKMADALGMRGIRDFRAVKRSPYLYGADISSTAILKQLEMTKYKDGKITPYVIAGYDIETDVLHKTQEIIVATLSCKDKVFTAVRKSFVEGHVNVIPRLQEMLQKYLGEVVEKRNIKWEIMLLDTEAKCVQEIFKRAHLWRPDFVTIWNMNFDIPKTINALVKDNIDPKTVFSDPIVPPDYQHFKYKEGDNQKKTSSGKFRPLANFEQWPSVNCPASFKFIDGMCTYYHVRIGEGQEQDGYSLNAVLDKNLGIRKLNFIEAEGLKGIDWHVFMQDKYPLEYVVYNVFDVVSMEMLDEVTQDLMLSVPMLSGCSDFSRFNSQPRRNVESLHWFVQNNNNVIGTSADNLKTEQDSLTVSCDDWIIMLPSELTANNGIKAIKEDPTISTNIQIGVGDLDVKSS